MSAEIQCDSCSSLFQEALSGSAVTKQGYKCATSATREELCGYFGSVKHDGHVYHWNGANPHLESLLNSKYELVLCDECVDVLLRNKQIRLVDKNRYF